MTAKQDKERQGLPARINELEQILNNKRTVGRQKMLDELADEIDVTYGDVLILVGKRARLLNSIRNWTPREE